jgi:hypothetical protein
MRYANVGGHLRRIQARQQCAELLVGLIDHSLGSDKALLNLIQLIGAQYKCHHYVLLCSHQ